MISKQYNSSGDTIKSKDSLASEGKIAIEALSKDSFGDNLVFEKLSFNEDEYYDFAENIDSDDESMQKRLLEVYSDLRAKFSKDKEKSV